MLTNKCHYPHERSYFETPWTTATLRPDPTISFLQPLEPIQYQKDSFEYVHHVHKSGQVTQECTIV